MPYFATLRQAPTSHKVSSDTVRANGESAYFLKLLNGLPYEALAKYGAGDRIRTSHLLITNQLLYQMSYAGIILFLERETRVELATYSLEGCRSAN